MVHDPVPMKNNTYVLGIIIGSYLIILVDTSIIMTGLPHIQVEIGLSPTTLSWAQSIYTLFFGGFLLIGARACDALGARKALEAGLWIFMTASVAIAGAQSPSWLLSARAFQGLGAAFVAPAALALLTLHFKEGEERNRAVAWYGSTAGIGASVGMVLGGWLADVLSWRAGFLLNLPLSSLLIFASRRYLHENPPQKTRFDFPGAILSTSGFGSLIYGVSRTAEHGWLSTDVLTFLVLSVALLALLVWHENRTASPLIPLMLFSSRRRVGAYLARFLFLGPMVAFFFFGSEFMQESLRFSALKAGLAFLPMTVFACLSPALVPGLIRRFGDSPVMIGGLLLIFVGLQWLSHMPYSAEFWRSIALPMILIGAGQGFCLAPMTAASISEIDVRHVGAASGVLNMAHQVGASFGLGLIASVATVANTNDASDTALNTLTSSTTAFSFGSWMVLLGAVIGGFLMRSRRTLNTAFRHDGPSL